MLNDSLQPSTYDKNLSRIITIYSFCILVGIALVMFVKLGRSHIDFVRQNWIFGILPNFGAGFEFPFLLINLGLFAKKSDIIKRLSCWFYIFTAASCLGLILWEYLQFAFWDYPIDPYDILATIVGAVLAVIVKILIDISLKSNQTKGKQDAVR